MADESSENHAPSVNELDLNRPPPGFVNSRPSPVSPSGPPPGFPPRPPPPPPPPPTTPNNLSLYEGFPGFEFRPTTLPGHSDQLRQEHERYQAELNKYVEIVFPQPPRLDHDFIFRDAATSAPSATELAKARSTLATDLPFSSFHLLIDTQKVAQLADISTMLLNHDPALNPHQVSMLKLIQKLPSTCETAIEVKELDDEIKAFLSSLRSKIQEASLLFGAQSKELKEKMTKLGAEGSVKKIKEELEGMRSDYNQLVGDFARVSGEIIRDDANTKKRVLQVKMMLLKDLCVKILSKFGPLKSFTM